MNPISGLFKLMYWPICRLYAKYMIGDKPADAVMRFLCVLQFWRVYRFLPNFVHPRRFSEKLWHRMLLDRDHRLTMLSDKLRVRDYVAKKARSEYLIPMLWSGDNPEKIPFNALPSKFVIKTNHGCGYNIIVKDKIQLDREKARRQLKKWLGENFCQDKYLGTEWGYKNIKPSIIIEASLEDDGKAPVDYKFYCFSGRVEILTLHFCRFEEHKTMAFDRNFKAYEFSSDFNQYGGEIKQPLNFEEMVQIVETLARGFDFIRVDLYNVRGRVYFSEYTPYPAGVSSFRGLDLKSLDYILGEKWKK